MTNYRTLFSYNDAPSDESLQYPTQEPDYTKLANLQVALANRQDKVKAHWAIALQKDPSAFGTRQMLELYTPTVVMISF